MNKISLHSIAPQREYRVWFDKVGLFDKYMECHRVWTFHSIVHSSFSMLWDLVFEGQGEPTGEVHTMQFRILVEFQHGHSIILGSGNRKITKLGVHLNHLRYLNFKYDFALAPYICKSIWQILYLLTVNLQLHPFAHRRWNTIWCFLEGRFDR